MKLTIIVLVIALVQASAKGYAQKITLNETNAPLEKVLSTIKQQSGYTFLYTDQDLKNDKITVQIKNASIEKTLTACFKNSAIEFKINGNNILLKQAEPSVIDKAKALFAQVTVIGKVVDETGQPLPGVTVKIKNTNSATTTDVKGAYTITVPDNNTVIVFSYIGFETVELAAKDIPNGSVINLKATAQNLHEVVVNKGYYSVKEELNTGNVTKVTGETINEQPVTDPMMALEGRVPGLYIYQQSGVPGASEVVRLRGQNSIANGNDPLYVIDGVPFSSGTITGAIGAGALTNGIAVGNPGSGLSPFNMLDPANIESIEVLKDADATAIYGSRGANGVILITTKKGKAGTTKVDFNFYTGAGKVTKMMDLLNTQQYLQMRQEAFKNDGQLPAATDYDVNGTWDKSRYTDWQKVLIGGTSQLTDAQVNVSGGNANTQFAVGGGYSRQTTVYPGDFFDQKASVHATITHVSTDQKFHFLFSAAYVNERNLMPTLDLTSQITLAPDAPALYDRNGNLNWQNNTWYNPLAYLLQTAQSTANNLISNVNLSYELLPGLAIKLNGGYTRVQSFQTNQSPATDSYGPPNPIFRSNNIDNAYLNTLILEPQLNYSRKLWKGKLDALLGGTFQENQQSSIAVYTSNYASDSLIPDVAAASTIRIGSDIYNQYRYGGLYARLNYTLVDKYILNLTGNRDGSSRFGPGKQYGNFGAIGAGWIFSKEKGILENLSWLNFGKLRASYGTTGNDQIADYGYLSTYTPYTSSTYLNVAGLSPTSLTNPYFGWEVVKKIEGGIEMGFLKDRIFLSADYYRNRTDNQLVGYTLPSITGFTTVQANLPATVQNSGVELELNTVSVKSNKFIWRSAFNITLPRNKLVSYPNLASSTYKNIYAIGQPLFVRHTYHFTGVDPQTGVYTFQDANNDGVLNTGDMQFSKQITQNYFGGFQNSFSYKGVQLDIFIQFVKQTGWQYYNQSPSGTFNLNEPLSVLDRWQTTGNAAQDEQFTQSFSSAAGKAFSNYLSSDAKIIDASFIRLKSLSLSYTLPRSWINQVRMQNARVYVQAQNLFTITGYKGLDPENTSSFTFNLPPLRMITAGVQFGL